MTDSNIRIRLMNNTLIDIYGLKHDHSIGKPDNYSSRVHPWQRKSTFLGSACCDLHKSLKILMGCQLKIINFFSSKL